MTMLESYWPIREEVNRCIKAEAETASDAVLLSVHQPTPLAIRDYSSLVEKSATEHELLEAFLTEDIPEGFLLMPITGASGVGKSHIVRWLSAQLNRIKDERGLEVILIPKSANLRTVVDLILKPLHEDKRYDEVRRKLKNVIAEVAPQDGATRFVAELKISLRNLSAKLTTEIQSNSGVGDSRDKRVRLDHARKLPDFFSDAELQKHFESSVLAPIIERAIKGRHREDDDSLPQFTADDLIVPETLNLGNASLSVKTYYQTTLNRDDGKGRAIAADVLNSVIDEAIRRVFNLDQTIDGITLEEIILHIRELLFEEGRELVLLIEDFAALSGIQEILLRICIQEGVRKGKQVRATMRTALAVTDGYLASRDTFITRAKREWLIRSALAEPNDVMERTINLVGSYLNAARWGESELERMFAGNQHDSEESLTQWISTYEDPNKSVEESDLLAAFETSARGESLFPFNYSSVIMLARERLMVSGQLIFNPRRVINFILREVLLQRDAFEKEQFPPPHFQQTNPRAEIASWLANANIADNVRESMKSFIVYWGGNPQTPELVAAIPPELFKTFSLPTPEDLGQTRVIIKIEPTEPTEPTEPASPKSQPKTGKQPIEDPVIHDWREKLDAWSGGTELGAQDANKLRKLLLSAIGKHIDWNSLCMVPRKLSLLIVIPNARGNDATAKYRIDLTDDYKDPSGVIRKTLLGAVRYEQAGNNWDYLDGDQDSALFDNLVEDIGQRIQILLTEERDKEISPLVSVLIQQGRVLGMLPKRLKYPDVYASVVVAESPVFVKSAFAPDSTQGKWEELQQEAILLRKDIRSEILDRIACFQGTGKKALAIDVTKIRKESKEDDGTQFEWSPTLKAHVTKLKPIRLSPRTRPLIKDLCDFYKLATDVLGKSLDKNLMIETFKGLLDILEAAAVWPEGEPGTIKWRNNIEAFRQTSLKELLDKLVPLLETDLDPASDIAIDCLGHIDFDAIKQSEAFLVNAKLFVDSAVRTVDNQSTSFEGVDAVADANAVEQELKLIASNLQKIEHKEVAS